MPELSSKQWKYLICLATKAPHEVLDDDSISGLKAGGYLTTGRHPAWDRYFAACRDVDAATELLAAATRRRDDAADDLSAAGEMRRDPR